MLCSQIKKKLWMFSRRLVTYCISNIRTTLRPFSRTLVQTQQRTKGRTIDDIPGPQSYSFVSNPDNILENNTVTQIDNLIGESLSNEDVCPITVIVIRGLQHEPGITLDDYAKTAYEKLNHRSDIGNVLLIVSAAQGAAAIYTNRTFKSSDPFSNITFTMQQKLQKAEFDDAVLEGVSDLCKAVKDNASSSFVPHQKTDMKSTLIFGAVFFAVLFWTDLYAMFSSLMKDNSTKEEKKE
jgi:hypothetical protein